MGKIEEEEVDDVALQAGGVEEELETSTIDFHIEQKARGFTQKPLTCLKEWQAVHRKDQDFAHTPIGFICQGKYCKIGLTHLPKSGF